MRNQSLSDNRATANGTARLNANIMLITAATKVATSPSNKKRSVPGWRKISQRLASN
ncbi:hypothetical protein D3C81_1982650 [compost metagenome]